uniref:Tropomodulin n=1 Tax=Acrobeloides nanus TaxID=290746 RepID=A0A914DE82_9BILA
MSDFDDDDLMTDDALLEAIDALQEEGDEDVGELLKMMNENRIISWEEAERILSDSNTGPVKCSLPPQTRPSEPDNDTDVEQCIRKLQANDPNLTQINLNNMKRIAVPQIRRIIDALRDNGFLEKLSLANMGLYDHDIADLISILEINETLRSINLETNYLTGDFFSKLFQSALKNQTLEEVKAVNQGVSFSTQAEREIIDAVFQNRGLTKVSISLRLPEGRHKVDQAMLRNQEIRRVLRRQMAEEQRRLEAEKAKKAEPESAQPPIPPKKRPTPKVSPPEEKKYTEPIPVYPLKKPTNKEATTPEAANQPTKDLPPEAPKKKRVPKKKVTDESGESKEPPFSFRAGLVIENKNSENEIKINGEAKTPTSPTKTVRPTNEKIPKLKSTFESN